MLLFSVTKTHVLILTLQLLLLLLLLLMLFHPLLINLLQTFRKKILQLIRCPPLQMSLQMKFINILLVLFLIQF
jgi:hypothetical protein